VGDLAWGLCPMYHPQAVPGYVVPWPEGGRFREPRAVRLGIHPALRRSSIPCIGSRQYAPVLPVAVPPTAAEGLALQREAETGRPT
jgi:hypothetical protein